MAKNKPEKTKCRKIFIYLAVIAIILGIIGIVIIQKNISGNIISEKYYSRVLVENHNTEQDCWVINEGKVYDITLFLQVYPEDLREYCGREIPLPLDKSLLHQYEIGRFG